MATSLPPLPTDSNSTGGGPLPPGANGQGPSPFAGGLSGLMKASQMIEAGCQMLAQMLPSAAPFAASTISNLRMVIPKAVGADAGQGQGQGAPPQGQPPSTPPPPPGS